VYKAQIIDLYFVLQFVKMHYNVAFLWK